MKKVFKEIIISSMCHNDVTLTDENFFVCNYLLKLRVRKDPTTREIAVATHGSSVSMLKIHIVFALLGHLLIATRKRK